MRGIPYLSACLHTVRVWASTPATISTFMWLSNTYLTLFLRTIRIKFRVLIILRPKTEESKILNEIDRKQSITSRHTFDEKRLRKSREKYLQAITKKKKTVSF